MRSIAYVIVVVLLMPLSGTGAPLAAASPEVAFGPNLLENPSFEEGTFTARGWTIKGAAVGVRDSSTAASGETSLATVIAGGSIHSNRAAVAQGEAVRAGAWFREDAGLVEGRLNFYDHAGTLVKTQIIPRAPTTEGRAVSIDTTAPKCAAGVEFVITGRARGHVDDAFLHRERSSNGSGKLFAEDWDTGFHGWKTEGAPQIDCAAGIPAPSLRLDPACCQKRWSVTRSGLDIALSQPTLVSFSFRGGAGTEMDHDVVLSLSSVSSINLAMNGGTNNREVTLVSHDHGRETRAPLFTWEKGTWYRVTIVLNPAEDTVHAFAADAEGAIVGASPSLGFPDGETRLRAWIIQAMTYSASHGPLHYDNLVIEYESLSPTRVLEESWDHFSGWTVAGEGASIDCVDAVAGCSFRMDPPCCGQELRVHRSLGVPMAERTTTALYVRTSGGTATDAAFTVGLSGDSAINVHFGEGAGNRGIILVLLANGQSEYYPFHTLERDTWYKLVVNLESTTRTVRANLFTLEGAFVAGSPAVPLPAGEDRVESIHHNAFDYRGESVGYGFDELVITDWN